MRKTHLLSILALFSILNCFGQLKYHLNDVTLKANQLCGKNICDPGNVGFLLHYTQSPFSPAVSKASTVQDIAYQVLGQTLPKDELLTSQNFTSCSKLTDNPFKITDIENSKFTSGGRNIDYRKSKKVEIDIAAAVEANVKELSNLTSDTSKINRLKVKIQLAYNKVKGTTLTVKGKYSEWQLSKKAMEELQKGEGYADCRKWIEENNQRIFLAVGIVYFDISYNQNSLDSLATSLDTEMAKEGLTASLSFSFKKVVTESISASSSIYQILIVRHAGLKNERFVETF